MAVSYSMSTPGTGIDQGADFYINFVYQNTGTGIAINLTGYTSKMQLKSSYDNSTIVLTLTDTSGITITGVTGTLAIHATAAQTLAIPAGNYYYDIIITSASGIVTRLIQGQIAVNAQVTK